MQPAGRRERRENGGERKRLLRHAPVVSWGYITASAPHLRVYMPPTHTYTHSFSCFFQRHTLAAHTRPPEQHSATHANHPLKSAFRGSGLNLTVSLLLRSPPSICVSPATCLHSVESVVSLRIADWVFVTHPISDGSVSRVLSRSAQFQSNCSTDPFLPFSRNDTFHTRLCHRRVKDEAELAEEEGEE